MKIICLLLIVANIFVFMWEYRNGAFAEQNSSQEQLAIYSTEKIILLSEKKEPPQIMPQQIQEKQLDAEKPSGDDNKRHNTTKKAELPQVQLP